MNKFLLYETLYFELQTLLNMLIKLISLYELKLCQMNLLIHYESNDIESQKDKICKKFDEVTKEVLSIHPTQYGTILEFSRLLLKVLNGDYQNCNYELITHHDTVYRF